MKLPMQSPITPQAPHSPSTQDLSLLSLTKRMGGLIYLTATIETLLRRMLLGLQMSDHSSPILTFPKLLLRLLAMLKEMRGMELVVEGLSILFLALHLDLHSSHKMKE